MTRRTTSTITQTHRRTAFSRDAQTETLSIGMLRRHIMMARVFQSRLDVWNQRHPTLRHSSTWMMVRVVLPDALPTQPPSIMMQTRHLTTAARAQALARPLGAVSYPGARFYRTIDGWGLGAWTQAPATTNLQQRHMTIWPVSTPCPGAWTRTIITMSLAQTPTTHPRAPRQLYTVVRPKLQSTTTLVRIYCSVIAACMSSSAARTRPPIISTLRQTWTTVCARTRSRVASTHRV